MRVKHVEQDTISCEHTHTHTHTHTTTHTRCYLDSNIYQVLPLCQREEIPSQPTPTRDMLHSRLCVCVCVCVCLFGVLMLSVPLIDREEGNEQSVTLTATTAAAGHIERSDRRFNSSRRVFGIELQTIHT